MGKGAVNGAVWISMAGVTMYDDILELSIWLCTSGWYAGKQILYEDIQGESTSYYL